MVSSIGILSADIKKSHRESGGQNNGYGSVGYLTVSHNHNPGVLCVTRCTDGGFSPCPRCIEPIIRGSNEDISLHNYARNQILLGNLIGSQVSDSGLWKVKWEKKQNNDESIVAWDLSGTEPSLWD